MRNLETTAAARLPENTDGPRAAKRGRPMGIRDDAVKVIEEVKKDLQEGEGYLLWVLNEAERHLIVTPPAAPAKVKESEREPADESDDAEVVDEEGTKAEETPARRRRTSAK